MNFSGLLKAPMYEWEVTMHRRASLNEVQNARRRIEYVQAPNERDALREANKRRPEFKAMSARRAA